MIDWGIFESVQFLAAGQLPLYWADDFILRSRAANELHELMRCPKAIFVTHPAEHEQIAGRNASREALAATGSLRKRVISSIRDAQGRCVLEIWQFE